MQTRTDARASATPSPTIFTIGHSTRALADFLDLLRAHGVGQIADVRTVPRSARHPQFSGDQLERSLAAAGLGYRHFAPLGGLRKPRRDSVNTAWREPGFRGYADHMQTDEFWRALDELVVFGTARATAVMCAEAVWWRCHRRLLGDALLVRGVPVRHILGEAPAKPHELSDFAKPAGGRVTYPGLL